MSRGDRFLDEVVRRVVPSPLGTAEAIRYRQASVTDAIASPDVVRQLYAIAVDAVDAERKVWGGSMRNPELILDRAAEVIGLFLESFRSLRRVQAERASGFTSPGFVAFFEHVASELDDAWLAEADDHVRRLRARTLHVSARLGSRQSRDRLRPPSTTHRRRGLARPSGPRGATVDRRRPDERRERHEHDRGDPGRSPSPPRPGPSTRPIAGCSRSSRRCGPSSASSSAASTSTRRCRPQGPASACPTPSPMPSPRSRRPVSTTPAFASPSTGRSSATTSRRTAPGSW